MKKYPAVTTRGMTAPKANAIAGARNACHRRVPPGYFYDHGEYVYDGGLRIPLAVVLPKADPSHRTGVVNDWVSIVDIMPTLVELLGLKLPAEFHSISGRSLVPYLRGERLPARPVFAECGEPLFPNFVQRRVRFDVAGRFRTVISGDWKLIWTPGQSDPLEFELYNLATDPDESLNLYAAGQPGTEAMKALLAQWSEARASAPQTVTAGDRERLRSLGYIE